MQVSCAMNDGRSEKILGDRRPFVDKGSSVHTPKKSRSLYVKEKKIRIVTEDTPNTSGSLFNLDDSRNYLYTDKGPFTVGTYLDVAVASSRSPVKEEGASDKEVAAGDAVEDTLIKALPALEPSDEKATMIKKFKMKVAHRYPNGDVLALVERSSKSNLEDSDIVIQARIPYGRLTSEAPLTTDDLVAVRMIETTGGDTVERSSLSWEDEYTLRMSGFNEAKSKMALELDSKRSQLKRVKDQLRGRLEALGKERKTMAKERNKFLADGAEVQKKVDTLKQDINEKETKIQKQKETIKSQEKEIENLSNPQNKPGDEQDGAEGA